MPTTITAAELAAELRRVAVLVEPESQEVAARARRRAAALAQAPIGARGWVYLASRGDGVALRVLELSRARA